MVALAGRARASGDRIAARASHQGGQNGWLKRVPGSILVSDELQFVTDVRGARYAVGRQTFGSTDQLGEGRFCIEPAKRGEGIKPFHPLRGFWKGKLY